MGANMKKPMAFCVAVLIFGSLALSQDKPNIPDGAPLLLVQEIPLPSVGGRIDHFTFDAKRKCVHHLDRVVAQSGADDAFAFRVEGEMVNPTSNARQWNFLDQEQGCSVRYVGLVL